MIKVIIFDLDGVLVNTTDLHYNCFNEALKHYNYIITEDEHKNEYNGLPTKDKLNRLTEKKGLSKYLHNEIWELKQKITLQRLDEYIQRDEVLIETIRKLSKDYKIYVASNSIWKTVKRCLILTGLMEYVDYFVSCEDIKNSKPSPEIYYRCFSHAVISPNEALILEDSPVGIKSAESSSGNVFVVNEPCKFSYKEIIYRINHLHDDKKINIVIPMAGLGSRFAKVGYKMPKPLIDVLGKAMIQKVVKNIGIKGRYIFIVQNEHYEKYYLDILLKAIVSDCEIIKTSGLTEGAACSVLLAKELINNDDSLVIANSDQLLDWNSDEFIDYCFMNDIDGCISTFNNNDPKFSYVKVNGDNFVTKVAEKVVISENASTGIYFWKQGSDFVKYAEEMINKNIRVRGEFYVAPVFNLAVGDNKKISIKKCEKFYCLGTPEDLERYISIKSEQIPEQDVNSCSV